MNRTFKETEQGDVASVIGRYVEAGQPQGVVVDDAWGVPYDVKQTDAEITVLMDMPGINENEISIEGGEGFLRVSARRIFNRQSKDAEKYTHIERAYGLFACSVELPMFADTEHMTAKCRAGVLKVRIPRKNGAC